jgi:hypothetical protein
VVRVASPRGEERRPVDLPAEAGRVTAAGLAEAVIAAHGQALGRRLLKGWRGDPKRVARLARRLTRPRGRRLLAHLIALPRPQRGRAVRAFVAESLPALLPAWPPRAGASTLRQGSRLAGPLGGPGREDWEAVFTAEDPFGYESGYERAKYEHTLELLPEGPIGRALELACAEGHFTSCWRRGSASCSPRTSRPPPRPAPRSAARAARGAHGRPRPRARPDPGRLRPRRGERGLLLPEGPPELAEVARKIAAALPAGGHLLTTHANLLVDDPHSTGFDWEAGFGAKAIAETFAALPDLEFVKELRTPLYRVALFRKRSEPARGRSLPREVVEREPVWPVLPRVAGGVVRGGAVVTRKDANGMLVTRRLPILMYHRIAAAGPEALATWRVSAERLEAQLDWLKRHGFRSDRAGRVARGARPTLRRAPRPRRLPHLRRRLRGLRRGRLAAAQAVRLRATVFS